MPVTYSLFSHAESEIRIPKSAFEHHCSTLPDFGKPLLPPMGDSREAETSCQVFAVSY